MITDAAAVMSEYAEKMKEKHSTKNQSTYYKFIETYV